MLAHNSANCWTCLPAFAIIERLPTAGRLLTRNAERYFKSPAEMTRLFSDLPEAVANTRSSLLAIAISRSDDLGYQFPKYPVPAGETQMSFLRQRTQEGMIGRYGPHQREGAKADRARTGAD